MKDDAGSRSRFAPRPSADTGALDRAFGTDDLLSYVGLYALVALGLVPLTGIGGLVSFGQAAFVGIGAYVTAYLTTRHGTSPWLTLPVCLAVAAAIALFIGLITLRLSSHYLAVATIAWGLVSISSSAISMRWAAIPGSAICRPFPPSAMSSTPLRCFI